VGVDRTRWTLASLLGACSWLELRTCSGLSGLLRRLRITWQRGRSYIHSPDPDYQAKLRALGAVRARLGAEPGSVLVYVDECTIYRHPSVAPAWAAATDEQPLARRSTRADTRTRLVASLDHRTGRVVHLRAGVVGVAALVQFYQRLVAAYPGATRIYVVLDNWPVHRHPDLLCALEPQETPWLLPLPPTWPAAPCPPPGLPPPALHLACRPPPHSPTPLGPPPPAHPARPPAYLRLLAQPHRAALAQTQSRRHPPPPPRR
jgi:hypothetical protein